MAIINNIQQQTSSFIPSTNIIKNGMLADLTLQSPKKSEGWVINISAGYRFASRAEYQVQVNYGQYVRPLLAEEKPKYTEVAQILINKQFDILCALLRADTCKTIYFDAAFNDAQLAQIRALQSCSKSELINTRVAFMFAQKKTA